MDDTRIQRGEVKGTLSSFAESTTVHGPCHIAQESNKIGKAFWVIVFLAALTGVTIHLYLTLTVYYSHPTHQSLYIAQEAPQFPHVTFCNENPISRENMDEYVSINPNSNTTWFRGQIAQLSSKFQEVVEQIPHMDDLFASAASYFENIGRHEATNIGHKFKDFVIDCTYAGIPCSKEDFDFFLHPIYFNCYTFTGKQVKKKAQETGGGPFLGLSVVLFLEKNPSQIQLYNRYSPVGNVVGTVVQLHSANDFPTPHIEGVHVPPGHSSAIAMHTEQLNKLQPPFGNCSARLLHTPADYHVSYTSSLCLALCQQNLIYQDCGCYMATQPFYGLENPTCGTFHLNASDSEKLSVYAKNMKCQNEASRNARLRSRDRNICDCPPECNKTIYYKSLSQTVWPADNYYRNFLAEFLDERQDKADLIAYRNLHHLIDTTSDEVELTKSIKEQFARVNVYFSDLEVVVRQDVRSYTLPQLWCDIGGTMGLWAGMSVITCLEVLQLLAKLLSTLCKSKSNDKTGITSIRNAHTELPVKS
nr:FMRFamide-gated sodium channel-like 1 [Malacoceros fuliginosus]